MTSNEDNVSETPKCSGCLVGRTTASHKAIATGAMPATLASFTSTNLQMHVQQSLRDCGLKMK